MAYGEISKSGDYIKKCEANVDASWDLIKIVPIANYLNVLYTKQNNEKSVSVAVSSIDMNSCEGRIFGPATIDEFWGAYHRKLFSIFPVGDSGELLLTHVHPAEPDDDARYNGGTTLVGTVEECLIQNRTNLYHLNKDLSLNKVHLWSDLRVLGTHQGQLMAVSYDPCTITDRASVIAPEWLISGDKPVWYYDGGKAQANAERALPELNRQFSKIVDWRRLNDHEFEYVEGASALTEYLFSADRDSRLSPKTVRFLRDSQYGLHVRKRGDTLWKKMVDESECPIIEPLIFSGVPVALCVDAKEQSFRVIRMQP